MLQLYTVREEVRQMMTKVKETTQLKRIVVHKAGAVRLTMRCYCYGSCSCM